MGRVSFHSPDTPVRLSSQEAFAFLSNLDNMQSLMPEQVINWKSNKESCSFDIKGMAHIDLFVGELRTNELVTIDGGPKNPIQIQIQFLLTDTGNGASSFVVKLNAELSMMLQMMASTPLQNLVNIMAGKLGELTI
jgi:carbon monoxide dehydrogenase subunit G